MTQAINLTIAGLTKQCTRQLMGGRCWKVNCVQCRWTVADCMWCFDGLNRSTECEASWLETTLTVRDGVEKLASGAETHHALSVQNIFCAYGVWHSALKVLCGLQHVCAFSTVQWHRQPAFCTEGAVQAATCVCIQHSAVTQTACIQHSAVTQTACILCHTAQAVSRRTGHWRLNVTGKAVTDRDMHHQRTTDTGL